MDELLVLKLLIIDVSKLDHIVLCPNHVYFVQESTWITMKLGLQVGIGMISINPWP